MWPLRRPTGDPLHVVQGDGVTSPLQRRRVAVEGVVTTAFQGDPNDPFARNLAGFYLRTLPGEEDDDPMTSKGLYVQSALTVSAGQVVRASGTVMEDYVMTVLTAVREVVDCGAMVPVRGPVALTLPFESLQTSERYEGMLVTLPQVSVISEYFHDDRFGEITLALPQDGFDRPIEATQLHAPDDPRAEAWREAQELRRITRDDGSNIDEPSMGFAPLFVEKTFEIIKTVNDEGISVFVVEQNAIVASRSLIAATSCRRARWCSAGRHGNSCTTRR